MEYTIKDFSVSDFKDNFGNVWCSVTFEEVGEPVRWVMKPESTETVHLDTKVTGEVKEMTSKAGKPYMRFYKAKDESPNTHSQQTDKAYLKDLSSMPLDVFRALLPYIDAQALVKGDQAYYGEVMTLIQQASDDLLGFSDNIRNGKPTPAGEPVKAPQQQSWEDEAKDEIDDDR